MTTALICVGVVITSQNLVITAVGIGVWLVFIGFFRLMAKHDPQLTTVYMRHMKYQSYYPPQSRPARLDP